MTVMRWVREHTIVTVVQVDRDEECCANCEDFRQMYTKIGSEYTPVSLGYCIRARRKKKQACGKCESYKRRAST